LSHFFCFKEFQFWSMDFMVQIIEPQIFGRGGLGNGMELSSLWDSTTCFWWSSMHQVSFLFLSIFCDVIKVRIICKEI
jgi:hypothetical protein